jgi:transcriptional regulator with XRE-family HTH domain
MTQSERHPLSKELDRHLTKAGSNGLDLTRIAAAAGISQGYLSHLRRGTRTSASRHVLAAIAETLGLDKADTRNLLEAGGFSDIDAESSAVLSRFRSRSNPSRAAESAMTQSDPRVYEQVWRSEAFGVEAQASFRVASPGKLTIKVNLAVGIPKRGGQELPRCTVSLVTDDIERSKHELTPAWPVVLPDVPEGNNELRWTLSIGDRTEQFVLTHRTGSSPAGAAE